MSDPCRETGNDGRHHKDVALVRRALARDSEALRTIMQMHNQRLYRMARALSDDESEAEDIVQESYVNAFAHFAEFRGDSALSTWLCRIVVNEALGRLRRKRRAAEFVQATAAANPEGTRSFEDAERTVAQRQIFNLVERATEMLPPAYRVVLIARTIEGLSNQETAELLGLRPETVRTRLHRARHLIRKHLDEQIGSMLLNAFPFKGRRCEKLINFVLGRLRLPA
jgi:RNA polymerase sigma-70 factor (ECF subfamily)